MSMPPSQAQGSPAAGRERPGRSLVPRRPRRAGVERFDDAIVVTRAQAWIGLLACLGLLGAVVVWACAATVNRTVTGSGVLLIKGTITRVASPAAGTLISWVAGPNQPLRESQPVGWVETPAHRRVAVTAPISGKVLDLEVGPGAEVLAGQDVASVTPVSGPVAVYTFLPPSSAQLVRLGMRADVSFPTGQAVRGRVTLVGNLPLTEHQVANAIGSPELAGMLAPNGAVTVAVTPDNFPAERAQAVAAHVASVSIIVSGEHPIGYIF